MRKKLHETEGQEDYEWFFFRRMKELYVVENYVFAAHNMHIEYTVVQNISADKNSKIFLRTQSTLTVGLVYLKNQEDIL